MSTTRAPGESVLGAAVVTPLHLDIGRLSWS